MRTDLNHEFYWNLNYYILPHSKNAFIEIDAAISILPNITKGKHLYGSIEWRYKNKSIGHMHGNRVVDILFPTEIQSSLLKGNRVVQNKYAKNGISFYIKSSEDIKFAIELLTKSYTLIEHKIDKK